MKLFKTLLFISILISIVLFASCIEGTPPHPPPPIERTEIPSEIITSIRSVEHLSQWLWRNYNYAKDEDWSGYRDYPLTPAEFFMSRIRLTNGIFIDKRINIGDCEDYAGLTAYLLWKALGYDAYIAVIPEFSQPNISHMIAYGYKDGACVVVNAPWVTNRYKSIEAYMAKVYPDKKLTKQTPIEDYLTSLYLEVHHRYWNDELSN